MKKLFLLIFNFSFFILLSSAQPFQVGHKQQTFVDTSRSNRNITAEIYYPANTAGDNVPVASGQFPVVVFGHGFVMVWSAYANIWSGLVPSGYIMVFPTTETGFSPVHLDFGKDLAFLVGAMKAEGLTSSSAFFGAVTNTSAVMGHSMGGGSSFLAVQFDSTITALASLAAANTTPSAITAANSITIPSIVFSGANDCVAPPPQHQVPMYDSLASSCKTFVSITGASHCQFANQNTNCYAGEGFCTPQATITATVQQGIVMQMLIPWLDFYLKGDCNAGTQFQNLITAGSGITSQQNCTLLCTAVENNIGNDLSVQITPNPFRESATLRITPYDFARGDKMNYELKVFDFVGKEMKVDAIRNSEGFVIRKSNLAGGIYIYKISTPSPAGKGWGEVIIATGKLIIE